MKQKLLSLLFFPFITLLAGCNSNSNVIKIFISSNNDVDIKALKADFSTHSLEVSYSKPGTYYYPYQYNTARENRYDIFILRDTEFVPSKIDEIYVPFNEETLPLIHEDTYTFYELDEVKYAIKLTDRNYKINLHITFEDEHDYYIGIAKRSEHCGKYSTFSNITSMLSYNVLDSLLYLYE